MTSDRREWLSILAKADGSQLMQLWHSAGLDPSREIIRAPEIGAVMTRGRMGATGAMFNLGEITVTRCSVRLAGGQVGHGYIQGRDKARAETVAVIDALMQTDAYESIVKTILKPLVRAADAARAAQSRKAAATRVDFFTMARGQD